MICKQVKSCCRFYVGLFFITFSLVSQGDVVCNRSVISSVSGRSTNTSQVLLAVFGQASSSLLNEKDYQVLYWGFMGANCIMLNETNSQGIPIEMDPDNDKDGLSDINELNGTAFCGFAFTDPNSTDTDGDGMNDYVESLGMFDPCDSDHRLKVSCIAICNEMAEVEWIGRGGGAVNEILWSKNLAFSPVSNLLFATNLSAGVAPWYKTTNTFFLDLSRITNFYIRVRITE